MGRPRKLKANTEVKAIRLLFKSNGFDCWCTLKGMCGCSDKTDDQMRLDEKNQIHDRMESIARKPPPE